LIVLLTYKINIMHRLIYNKNLILFLTLNDLITLKRNELNEIKNNYLNEYDNCIIYNYYDLKNHKILIKDRIAKFKHINQKKINARECNINVIDNNVKNDFLKKYHIQGADKSSICFGAYFENELIAIMAFDDSVKMNGGVDENTYNLSRFSVKTDYIIVGIFNKILSRFIKEYSPKKIISFADLNYVNKHNNIYSNNNFKLSKTIPPDFKVYLKNKDEIFHKFTYGRKFMKNEKISVERKNEVKENLHQVWNCGKLKYELLIENNEIVYGFIYMIKNKINNKIYVGQTARSLNKRIYEYKKAYNFDKFHNQYLGNAFKKYGWDSFEFSIIDIATSIEELNEKEVKYITQYNSTNKDIGYNIAVGGNNAIPGKETLEKMSIAHSGSKQNPEWVAKRIPKAGSEEAKKYGRPKTEEDKQHLSEISPKFWQGKKRDEETIRKLSETKKALGFSQKQKEANNKKVYKINFKTKEVIRTYESTAEASKSECVSSATISRWCSKDKLINDEIIWSYCNISEFNEEKLSTYKAKEIILIENSIPIKKERIVSKETRDKLSEAKKGTTQSPEWVQQRIERVSKPVIKINAQSKIVLENFPSLADAGRHNKDNLSYQSILRLCLGYSKQDNDIIWCYEEDFNNNSIPLYTKSEVINKNELSKEFIDKLYDEYKNKGVSIRELSNTHSINFFTLSGIFKEIEKPKSFFTDGCTYIAICKKTNKKFSDYINKSGALTNHIVETYPNIVLESKFKRKQIEMQTGKPWYFEYFDFIET